MINLGSRTLTRLSSLQAVSKVDTKVVHSKNESKQSKRFKNTISEMRELPAYYRNMQSLKSKESRATGIDTSSNSFLPELPNTYS